MTDDKIIEAVARAIMGGLSDSIGTDPPWDDPEFKNESMELARVAIEAYKAALAADGFVIHRFHDWVYPDPLNDPMCLSPHCRRCGIQMGGVLDAASCVPGEATTERKERE